MEIHSLLKFVYFLYTANLINILINILLQSKKTFMKITNSSLVTEWTHSKNEKQIPHLEIRFNSGEGAGILPSRFIAHIKKKFNVI